MTMWLSIIMNMKNGLQENMNRFRHERQCYTWPYGRNNLMATIDQLALFIRIIDNDGGTNGIKL